MDNPELGKLPVFRDCALVMRGACQQALIGEIDREQADCEAWKRPNFLFRITAIASERFVAANGDNVI